MWLRRTLVVLGVWWICGMRVVFGQAEPPTPEEAREAQVVERLLGVLEKNPRRGPVLDRVYGDHVERGTVDRLVKTYRDRAANDPNDGAAWMLLGLFEAQRGRDASAVDALRHAETARPADPLPGYYLGQSLLLVGQTDAAEQAFERALERRPGRADLLEIYQALGRLHQRAQRPERALAVWARLERLLPDDQRVREQIASLLADEGQAAEALSRYEALAQQGTDPARRVRLGIEAADLKIRLGRAKEALADLDGLLDRLNPDAWLYREVRRRIEEVYLRTDDQAGLAAYYERRVKAAPDDLDAMTRLARALAALGRGAEARSWLDRAVKAAPSRREIRLALIDQLVREDKVTEAADQYQALAASEGYNPDTYRAWGRLLLRDARRPEAERRAAAAAVWRRMAESRPDDPLTATQAADLLAQAGLTDDALTLYRRAIALAPAAPQYREYLGRYLHDLNRQAEAVDALRPIAAGANRNAANLRRLAEVLAGLGNLEPAVEAAVDACRLEPDDLDLRIFTADLLHRARKFAEALAQLDAAAPLAADDDQAQRVLEAQIKNYQASRTLPAEIARLRRDLDAGKEATAARWVRLARLLGADRQFAEASLAAQRAIQLDDRSVAAWRTAAAAREAAGDLGGAADAFGKLAALDRRDRTESLSRLATLEARLGRVDRAVQAGRDLLAAAPGNPDHAAFFADLCFEMGRADDGFDALRRAIRANPADTGLVLTLAEALARHYRTDEAIEMFWRGFARAPELDGRLRLVSRLAELYLVRNQFDGLLARLRGERRAPGQERELALCLAQAHAAVGDHGSARLELEAVLAANPRDADLLEQISGLAEAEGDYQVAARFQRQAIELKPSPSASHRLAQLYVQAGELTQAEAIWESLAGSARQKDLAPALATLDSLIGHDRPEVAADLAEKLLRAHPDDWELLYRAGVALARRNRPAEAERRFRALLALRLPDSRRSVVGKGSILSGQPSPSVAFLQRMRTAMIPLPLARVRTTPRQVRRTTGLDGVLDLSPYVLAWSPEDFGQARMGCLGWLLSQAVAAQREEALIKSLRDAAEQAADDPRPLTDLFYLELVREDGRAAYPAALRLARAAGNDPEAQFFFLESLRSRSGTIGSQSSLRTQVADDETSPLPGDEIDQLLASYRFVRRTKPDWTKAETLLEIDRALKQARREDDRRGLLRELADEARDAGTLASALELAAENGDVDRVLTLYDRAQAVPGVALHIGYGFLTGLAVPLGRAMNASAAAGRHADLLRIYDHYLASFRAQDRNLRTQQRQGSYQAVFRSSNRVVIWLGERSVNQEVEFPAATTSFDLGAIQLLRNAFELFKRDGKLDDLAAHLRAPLTSANEADRAYAHLGLACLHAWNNQRDQAAREMDLVIASGLSDPELRLARAELLQGHGKLAQALAAVDSVEPTDQKMMQRCELMALRLAVQTGSIARARKAAERLFALRLETDVQIQVAAQMQQLGMPELAEAILTRARRRAGGKTGMLAILMRESLRQSRTDEAVQMAREILRKTPPLSLGAALNGEEPDRQEAIQVLARTGRLKETIGRLEAQARSSPTALPILQTLAAYYLAAGQRTQARAVADQIVSLRPDDARLRFQVGLQLANSADLDGALEHFRAALKADPSLIQYRSNVVLSAYQKSGNLDELLALIEGLDLRLARSPAIFMRLATTLSETPAYRERAHQLMLKLWRSFPETRPQLFARFKDRSFVLEPSVLDDLCEAMLPGPTRALTSAWEGFDTLFDYSEEGFRKAPLNFLFELAAKQGRPEELSRRIEAALATHPQWRGGIAARAVLHARTGRIDEARAALQGLLDDSRHPVPPSACQCIAEELTSPPPMLALAIAFGKAVHDRHQVQVRYEFSATRALSRSYRLAGRNAEARAVLMSFLKSQPPPAANETSAFTSLTSGLYQAEELRGLGYPADADRLIARGLLDRRMLRLADFLLQYYRGVLAYANMPADELPRRIRQARKESARPIEPADAVRALRAWIGGEPLSGESVDLALVAGPRELDRVALRSLWLEAARLVPAPERPGLRAELAKVRPGDPRDLSAAVASALLTIAWDDAAAVADETRRLGRLLAEPPPAVSDTPVAPLSLWVVAREARARGVAEDLVTPLETRALELGGRLEDPSWKLAMLREQGASAQARGDHLPGAERAWGGMLDLVLRREDPDAANRVVVATPDQFEQAAEVAGLAARHGQAAFALRALRTALSGGMPVDPIAPASSLARLRTNQVETPVADGSSRLVAERLGSLIPRIAAAGANADDIERALRAIVMPDARPTEILLAPAPLTLEGDDRPASAGSLLVRWAVRAGKGADLARAVEARRGKPLADVAADVLLVMLALEEGQPARASDVLKTLAGRLGPQAGPTLAELACQAIVPALARPDTAVAASAAAEAAAKGLARSAGGETLPTLGILAARSAFARRQPDEGRRWLARALEALDRSSAALRGEPALVKTRQNLARIAREAVRAELAGDTLERLGPLADTPLPAGGADAPLGDVLASLGRQLGGEPPSARYERLKAWTLPAPGRKSVRLLAGFVSDDLEPPPTSFGPGPRQVAPTADPFGGVLSTAGWLIAAAREAGALDDLARALEPLAAQRVEGAEPLFLLVELARGRGAAVEARLRGRAAASSPPTAAGEDPASGKPIAWSDYLLARACLADPGLAPHGQAMAGRLLSQARARKQPALVSHLGHDLYLSAHAAEASAPLHPDGPGPWLPSSLTTGRAHADGALAARWVADGGSIRHASGEGQPDLLVFAYPLTGTFEVEVEASAGAEAQGHVGFGPLAFQPLPAGPPSPRDDLGPLRYAPTLLPTWPDGVGQVRAWGTGEWLEQACPSLRTEGFNTYTLQVAPGRVRCLVNGALFHEDPDPGSTAPWLALAASGGRNAAFRRVAIRGEATIPRQVELTRGDRLDGWFSSESQPQRLPGSVRSTRGEPGAWESLVAATALPAPPEACDWFARDGEVHGRGAESRLVHVRPLRDGETLSYEFFHDPGRVMVHPSIGRLAFLLEPSGLRLHWSTDGAGREWSGLDPANVADEPAIRRGPAPLPLRAGAWNALRLTLVKDRLALELNRQPIGERTLEPGNDRRFGLFHDHTEARVRNVVLSGSWPSHLDGDLLGAIPPAAKGR